MIKIFISLSLIFLLQGCINLFPKVKELPQTYNLSSQMDFQNFMSPSSTVQLVVEEPYAPFILNSPRIAVKLNPYSVDYYAGVRWADKAPRVVQNILIDAFEASGKLQSILRDSTKVHADYLIASDLHDFYVIREPSISKVQIKLSIKLICIKDRSIVSTKVFTYEYPTNTYTMNSIVAAFDQTLKKICHQVVPWTLSEISKHKL